MAGPGEGWRVSGSQGSSAGAGVGGARPVGQHHRGCAHRQGSLGSCRLLLPPRGTSWQAPAKGRRRRHRWQDWASKGRRLRTGAWALAWPGCSMGATGPGSSLTPCPSPGPGPVSLGSAAQRPASDGPRPWGVWPGQQSWRRRGWRGCQPRKPFLQRTLQGRRARRTWWGQRLQRLRWG